MVERDEVLVGQMVNHDILLTDRIRAAIHRRDGSWFDIHGRIFNPERYIYEIEVRKEDPSHMPSLEHTRAITAHYLGLARNPSTFYQEHNHEYPKPTEEDRLTYCEFIEFHASITGLLNFGEIDRIRNRGWWAQDIGSMSTDLFFLKEKPQLNFSDISQKTHDWKREGWRIALFHGAFDPVTLAHLQTAAIAYSYGSVTGVPIKLIIGFDSDALIKRKGLNRPRYPLEERRRQFGGFWMADETVVLRPETPSTGLFIKDYRDLGVDYVVTTTNPEDVKTRFVAIFGAGIECIPIPEATALPSATEILEGSKK